MIRDARLAPAREKRAEKKNGLDERLKEKAIELFRRLEQIPELPKFDGACIDYHWDKPAVVFIPEKKLIAEVENGELPQFLWRHGVRKVLVDALWPGNAGIMRGLVESGVEVYVLTRASALHGWRKKGSKGKPRGLVEWLLKHHPEVLRGFKEDIKNDAFDAVLLRYVKPKFTMRVTEAYLECWIAMILWRRARREHQRLLQQLAVLPISEEEKRMRNRRSEEELLDEAKIFVETVRRCYLKVDELFRELGINDDDIITQALACEVFLEIDESKGLRKNMNKAALKKARGKRKFIYDKRLSDAITQLTLKVWGNRKPMTEEEKIQFARMKREIEEKVWRFKRRALSRAAWSGEAL